MPFFNREKDIKQLKAVLSGEPNLVYFVYGPINSGKTALLTKVFQELPENYVVFYINFRGIYISKIDDLLQVLFEVKEGEQKLTIKELVKEFLKEGAKLKGIPIPERVFDLIFTGKRIENIFRYLERLFEGIKEQGKIPVFVLDEIQTIREIVNEAGKPIIGELFNFFVRLTKETHLCHSLCSTSDCLFIEEIYSNARLEGRAKYILVDDLEKEEAFKVYEGFGFKNKELVWDYIGGKIGDMVKLYEDLKTGVKEEKALENMLKDETARLEWIKLRKLKKMEKEKKLWEFLRLVKEKNQIVKEEIEDRFEELLFWIEENILFYNPLEGTVRPQSRLIWKAIKAIFRGN